METLIRKTNEGEFQVTENLTREAFWNLFSPGCSEHLVLNKLRKSSSYLPELDMVAVTDDKIIGHIISTSASVVDTQNVEHMILCVGPISVLPEFQKCGTGSKLMHKSIEKAKQLGYKGMILYGNPDYYHRFGFVDAEKFEITTKDGYNYNVFMALELYPDALANVKGKFYEDTAFETDKSELKSFDQLFPKKRKGKAKIKITVVPIFI